jgi:elongation factor 3
MTDAFGNTVKVKEGKKELSRKDQKAKHRLKQMRLKRGEEISSDDDY